MVIQIGAAQPDVSAERADPHIAHEFNIKCRCPVDGKSDVYTVIVETGRTIPVEDIVRVATRIASEPLYQEAFTELLARDIGARVRTIGYHGGVKTTCFW